MKTLNNTPFKKKNITNSGDSRGLLAFFLNIVAQVTNQKTQKK